MHICAKDCLSLSVFILPFLNNTRIFSWTHGYKNKNRTPQAALQLGMSRWDIKRRIVWGFSGTFFDICLWLLFFLNKFIYFWLCGVFVAAHGLSLVAASGDFSSLWCAGFSLQWLFLLWSRGSRALRLH